MGSIAREFILSNSKMYGVEPCGVANIPGSPAFRLTGQHHCPLTLASRGGIAAGTLIATPDGPRAVELLSPGDLVQTRRHGVVALRQTLRARLSPAQIADRPELRPVTVADGTMGAAADMVVSPHQRILVTGARAEAKVGLTAALIAARHMVNDRDLKVDTGAQAAEYFVLCFDEDVLVQADGLWLACDRTDRSADGRPEFAGAEVCGYAD